MSQEDSERIMQGISTEAPGVFRQGVSAAAISLNFRPKYLQKQSVEKRIASIRRAMARPASDTIAEEMLAVYFLKCRLELLSGWLDLLGLAHEDGILTDDEIACPDASELEKKVSKFRAKGDADCELLLRVFAGQAAIEWPALDDLLANTPG